MTSFKPKNYSPSLRRLVPKEFKLKNESRLLLCSILHEINEIFVKACLSKNGKYQVISPKSVQESIKTFIPNGLRKYAFAAGSNELFEYSTGLLKFRAPKPIDKGADEEKLLRKALTCLALAAQPQLTLSKKCTTIMGVMKHLMTYFVEETAACINDDNQQSLENMRSKMKEVLGPELFQHAEGHAYKNLEWYWQDLLHYPLKKPPEREVKRKEVSEEDKIFIKNIQRFAKTQRSQVVPKDAALKISMTLREIISKMVKEANQITSSDEEFPSVTAAHMQEILKTLFPKKVYRNALAQGRANLMNYSYGFLKYDDGKKVKEVEPVKEVVPKKPKKLYFRSAVIPLMKERNCTAGKGSVKYVNEILNDIVKVLVKKCSKQENNDLVGEDHVIAAVNELLPKELRDHALGRMMYIKGSASYPRRMVSKHVDMTSKQIPKSSQEMPKPSQQLANTSEELSETSQLLPNITQLLPSISKLLPNVSQFLPNLPQQLFGDSSLADRPSSEEVINKPPVDSFQDKSKSGSSIADLPGSEEFISKPPADSFQDKSKSGSSIADLPRSEEFISKPQEDSFQSQSEISTYGASMEEDDISMETNIENADDESSTKKENSISPLQSMYDQKDMSENKLQDHMDTGSHGGEIEDKSSSENGKNDFLSPSEKDLKNANSMEQLKRKNDQENGMLKHGVGSKSKESLVNLNDKKTNKNNNQGELFLNIPKNSYWLDVRPYEFLK